MSETTIRSFADVDEISPDYVWAPFIQSGQVTILCARGGTGKSMLAVDVTARVTTGADMPDGSAGQSPANVVYVSLEDSPEFALKARLRHAGADLSRVYDASEFDGRPFDIVRDISRLYEVSADVAPALIVIDTLSAASPVSLTAVKPVRTLIVGPLLALAAQTGSAVLLIHHLTKAGQMAGSQALMDSVRQVLAVTPAKTDSRVKVLSIVKTNIGSAVAPSASYRIVDGPSIEWLDSSSVISTAPVGTAKAKILLALQESAVPMSAQQVAASTGVPYATCRMTLSRAVKAGMASQEGMNSYAAAE
jgi:putative DNA primase/helicase